MPSPEVVERLDKLIERLTSEDSGERAMAVAELLEVRPAMLPAVEARLRRVADTADKDAMKRLLERTRRRARDDLRRSPDRDTKVKTPDYLEMLTQYAAPDDEAWRALVEVVAMSRMLKQIGTIEAARMLVELYVRFGEFLRVDTQLQLEALGDRGVAALIEARRHQAKKISQWAERQLDVLGKAIPSETVQTKDYEALADILRAYGMTRDPDAARILISFCNSERGQIREAARQAVVLLGDVAIWQLRDAFENVTGERPPRDWSWERTARELFGRFDRQRHARVLGVFEEGLAALAAGDLQKMKTAFDRVLARSPTFERAGDMAAGYLRFATVNREKNRSEALDAARRAERITDDSALRKRATSLRLTFEALDLLDGGLVDQALLRQALTLDPENALARDTLDAARHGDAAEQTDRRRWDIAGVIGGIALLAIAWVGLRRRRLPHDSPDRPTHTRPEASSPPEAPPLSASHAVVPPAPDALQRSLEGPSSDKTANGPT